MKYYRLTFSIDNNEIGCFPQSETAENYNFLQSNMSILKINPIPILRKKAILTSLLLSAPITIPKLIIDDNLLSFLKSFLTNDEYQSSKIKVKKGNAFFYNYNLFMLLKNSDEIIVNFEKSLFFEGSNTNWQQEGNVIKINNYQDYLDNLKREGNSDYYLKTRLLFLNFSNLKNDIIYIGKISLIGGYFISENLKKLIEEKKFSGFSFQEIEEIDNRIKVIYRHLLLTRYLCNAE